MNHQVSFPGVVVKEVMKTARQRGHSFEEAVYIGLDMYIQHHNRQAKTKKRPGEVKKLK